MLTQEMIRIFNTGRPTVLYESLDRNSYTMNRPLRVCFYDSNRLKVGRQVFSNRVSVVSKKLKYDWHFSRLSPDSICIQLKDSLVKYPSNTSSQKDMACFLSSRLELALRNRGKTFGTTSRKKTTTVPYNS